MVVMSPQPSTRDLVEETRSPDTETMGLGAETRGQGGETKGHSGETRGRAGETRGQGRETSSPGGETRGPAGIVPEAVVVVAGPFEGATVERWERLIAESLSLAPRRLVVDLRACPALDAAAIAVLLRAHRAMVATGGRLTLRGPTGRSGRMLRLARVDQVFDIDEG